MECTVEPYAAACDLVNQSGSAVYKVNANLMDWGERANMYIQALDHVSTKRRFLSEDEIMFPLSVVSVFAFVADGR